MDDSITLRGFFYQSDIPKDVRDDNLRAIFEARREQFAAWRAEAEASGLLESPLGGSDRFFDVTRGIRAKPTLSLTLEHVKGCLESAVGAGARARDPDPGGARVCASVPAGLSNVPYLSARPTPVLEMLIRPASVRIRLRPSRKYCEYDVKTDTRDRSIKRGNISRLSNKSMLNMRLKAADLGETTKATHMVTLTYPKDWRAYTTDWTCRCEASEGSSDVPCVCEFNPSGKVVKTHIRAFRNRLTRYLGRFGFTKDNWGAFWFFEFQRRGAPHIHFMFFGSAFTYLDLRQFKRWLSRAWAEICDNGHVCDFDKHVRAGTRAEVLRKGHFGYALKYASKTAQKAVPDGFKHVGRFWGVWNDPVAPPIFKSINTTAAGVEKIVFDMLLKSYKHVSRSLFYRRVADELCNSFFSTRGSCSFTLFGVDMAAHFKARYSP